MLLKPVIYEEVFDSGDDGPPTRRAPRKRGRPLGSRSHVVRTFGLSMQDFAILRSVVEGLDPLLSLRRYVDRAIAPDDVEPRLQNIWHRLRAATVANPALADLYQQTLAPKPAVKSPPPISLEEFASSIADDFFSEADLIRMYEEEIGAIPVNEVEAPVQSRFDRVNALNALQEAVGLRPRPDHDVSLWVEAPLCDRIKKAGIHTVSDLFAYRSAHKSTWFSMIEGLGRTRAQRLATWLDKQFADELLLAVFTPLERYEEGFKTSGSPILLRDAASARKWLAAAGNACTARTYRSALEKLLLWSHRIARKEVARLTASDLVAFSEFLASPPRSWCSLDRIPRSRVDWKPFRSGLKKASVDQTLTVVQSFLATHGQEPCRD